MLETEAAGRDRGYREFLRSRWPARIQTLVKVVLVSTVVLFGFDVLFSRLIGVDTPVVRIAVVRLSWIALALGGWALAGAAPGWRLLPLVETVGSLVWTWGNDWAYFAIGLSGTTLHTVGVVACFITGATYLPLTPTARFGMYGGMAAGHLALQLAADDPRPLGMRLWSDAMVLALVVVVGFIFEEFARAARRSYHMRNELERTVGALETSRARISETAAGVASSAKQLEQSAAELLGRASASDADGEAVARESKRLAEAARALQARSRESAATASDAQKRAVAVAALIEDIEAGVADVSAAVVTAEAAFGELRARAEDIGSFAETAKDLASQTQMVSINAGIEASAAGANGKGFAVIAREVSKLSQESRAGAQAVALIVEELQRRMGALLGSLEQVRSRTGHFTSTFGNARASLEQINGIVDALGAAMQANARDADAQAEATAAVSWSTSRMTDGLRAQAAVSAGVAGTSSALAQHAAGLRSLLPVDPRKEAAEAATVRPPPAPAK